MNEALERDKMEIHSQSNIHLADIAKSLHDISEALNKMLDNQNVSMSILDSLRKTTSWIKYLEESDSEKPTHNDETLSDRIRDRIKEVKREI